MDNQADDELVPTEFTETWVPLPRTREVMQLLNTYFTEPREDAEAYRRTGTYAWELYSAMPSPFWLSPAHSSGDDEWKDGVFRVDPYWFADNADDPTEDFFPQPVAAAARERRPVPPHWGGVPAGLRARRPQLGRLLPRAVPALGRLPEPARRARPEQHLPHGLLARPLRAW